MYKLQVYHKNERKWLGSKYTNQVHISVLRNQQKPSYFLLTGLSNDFNEKM